MELIDVSSEKQILQSNVLTSSRFEYTACQMDILFMIMSTLQKGDPPNKKYPIYVSDIEAITARKWNYQHLREATADMGSRTFEMETDKIYKQFWLFQHCDYHMGKGYFDVMLSETARELLFDLKTTYSVLQLKAALACSSKYAKRLYTLGCQWRTAGEHTYDIGELKIMLGLKDPKGKVKEQFERISSFETFVLKIAKEQINLHTDIKFDYELIKRGRSFSRVKIKINQSKAIQQATIDFNDNDTNVRVVDNQDKRNIIRGLGFTGIRQEQMMKVDMKVLEDNVSELNSKTDKLKIKDASAYFLQMLINKKIIPA